MPYLILAVALVIGLALIIRGTGGIDPKRAVRLIALVVGVVAVLVMIYFAATRGIGALWAVLAFLLPVFLRWRAARRFFRNLSGPSPGQSSEIETRFLRMKLDHDSGVLDGTVLEGRFEGRRLGEMSESEVIELVRECRIKDEQSAAILETYVDRIYGTDWRSGEPGGEEATRDGTSGSGSRWGRGGAAADGSMTREEAYEILGLEPGASAEDIKAAHRKLMQKMHPDRGGSNFLASKINRAKDLLLRG